MHSFIQVFILTWSVLGHLLGDRDPSQGKVCKTLTELIFWWNSPLDSPFMELHTMCCYSFVWSIWLVFSSSVRSMRTGSILAKHCTSRIHTVLTHKRHFVHICWVNRLVNSQSFMAGLWASSNCSWTLRTINRFACLEMTKGHYFLDKESYRARIQTQSLLTQKLVFYSLLLADSNWKPILKVFRDISKGNVGSGACF